LLNNENGTYLFIQNAINFLSVKKRDVIILNSACWGSHRLLLKGLWCKVMLHHLLTMTAFIACKLPCNNTVFGGRWGSHPFKTWGDNM